MAMNFYTGERLSYSKSLSTVRYIGPVKGTKGEWLGVEWDDPSRGKHNGEHEGLRYFSCQSKHPTAASFIRPSRTSDQALAFLEALRSKYASDKNSESGGSNQVSEQTIQISGKTVEEVGFEKIRQQLATLRELQIVVLDGLCVAGVQANPWSEGNQENWLQQVQLIGQNCPKISELDLSENLLEQWGDIAAICSQLPDLEALKINRNRFRDLSTPMFQESELRTSCLSIKELGLDETLLSWDQLVILTSAFPSLTHLSFSSNSLSHLPCPLPTPNLTSLTLSGNNFTTLSSLTPLTHLQNLTTLSLRSNSISTIYPQTTTSSSSSPPSPPLLFPTLLTLNLSHNSIPTFTLISHLPTHFPSLLSLHTTQNPFTTPLPPTESSLLTIPRIPTLTSLNHTRITPPDRTNAELYYLSTIARALSSTPASHEPQILAHHPRYSALCALHGAPTITRSSPDDPSSTSTTIINPNSLAARLITFTFHFSTTTPPPPPNPTPPVPQTHHKQIPRTISTYRLKSVVGRLYSLPPMHLRLIWETDEWDPIAASYSSSSSSSSSDSDSDDKQSPQPLPPHTNEPQPADERPVSESSASKKEKPGWRRREIELRDGPREIGFWIDASEARVRVEWRDGLG
ncbi:hypothetical protein MMC20_004424 [Loxospora ochrophaea]|nr:hypothetical protein [Loxospora ochrophaea]